MPTGDEASGHRAEPSADIPTLRSSRLVPRPFRLADAANVQRLAGDWSIADTTLNVPHPYEDGMAEQWIATHRPRFQRGELVTLAITLRDSGELIGALGLRLDASFDMAALGYWIARAHWNSGYCTEAAALAVDYGFGVLQLNRIHANHLARNPASGRVMQKIGMTREGLLRQHTKKWDKYEDLVVYGLLRQDWRANRPIVNS